MKKLMIFSLFVLSMNAGSVYDQFSDAWKSAAEKYDKRIENEEKVLATELGQKYAAIRQAWFREGCAEYAKTSSCNQATQMFEVALAELKKTEAYQQLYLPRLNAEYLNARKYDLFALALALPAEERVAGVEKYAQEQGSFEPSTMWLELSHNRGELDKQALTEVCDFIARNMQKPQA